MPPTLLPARSPNGRTTRTCGTRCRSGRSSSTRSSSRRSTRSAQLISCSMAAFAFAVLRFRFREPLFALLLVTLIIPFQVVLVPNFILYRLLPASVQHERQLDRDPGAAVGRARSSAARSGRSCCASSSCRSRASWPTRPASTARTRGRSTATSTCRSPARPWRRWRSSPSCGPGTTSSTRSSTCATVELHAHRRPVAVPGPVRGEVAAADGRRPGQRHPDDHPVRHRPAALRPRHRDVRDQGMSAVVASGPAAVSPDRGRPPRPDPRRRRCVPGAQIATEAELMDEYGVSAGQPSARRSRGLIAEGLARDPARARDVRDGAPVRAHDRRLLLVQPGDRAPRARAAGRACSSCGVEPADRRRGRGARSAPPARAVVALRRLRLAGRRSARRRDELPAGGTLPGPRDGRLLAGPPLRHAH